MGVFGEGSIQGRGVCASGSPFRCRPRGSRSSSSARSTCGDEETTWVCTDEMPARRERMPQQIGIMGGSAEGAALCYRTVCIDGAVLLGGHAHPEVSMHTQSLQAYVECIERNDWPGVGQLMLDSARRL